MSKSFPEVQQHTMIERLKRIKPKLVRSQREYDSSRTWQKNAYAQQGMRPFRAIIQSDNPYERPDVLCPIDLWDGNDLWHVDPQLRIARTRYGRMCGNAGAVKSRVAVHRSALLSGAALREGLSRMPSSDVCQGGRFRRIEVHISGTKRCAFGDSCVLNRFSSRLPSGVKVDLCFWNVLDRGERLHSRYVLTDLGGLAFEGGLDEGTEGETTDVYLLDEKLWRSRYDNFKEGSDALSYSTEYPRRRSAAAANSEAAIWREIENRDMCPEYRGRVLSCLDG